MRKAIQHLKKADPVIGMIIEQVGPYRMAHREPTFETLVRSIVFQQLSGKAAATIFGRLAAAAGGPVSPEAILRLTADEMRTLGLSRQKTAYVRDLAERTIRGEIDFSALDEMPDKEVIKTLTAVKGVGVWTVHMFLMFALKRPNVLPTGDLGVQHAIRRLYKMRQMPKAADIEKRAKKWHPYCSVATWYLWRSLEGQADI
jgi:DNA-3-methyladenine glycosylase II